ncbi:hypothetical protein D9M72_447350 [compost metagenome]
MQQRTQLAQHRAHAAGGTHGHDAILGFAAASFQQDVAGLARARHAIRVTDGNRAAVDVDALQRQAKLVNAIQRLAGKGFVEFPQVDVIDGKLVAFEQARDCADRADAHFVRLHPSGGQTDEVAQRFQATPFGLAFGHHHQRRGPVRQLARIAGRHLVTLALYGRQHAQSCLRGVGTDTFVRLEQELRRRRLAGHLVLHRLDRCQRNDFLREAAGLLSCHSKLLAAQRERVGALPRHAVALGEDFGRIDHVQVNIGAILGQPRFLLGNLQRDRL